MYVRHLQRRPCSFVYDTGSNEYGSTGETISLKSCISSLETSCTPATGGASEKAQNLPHYWQSGYQDAYGAQP